MGRRQQSESIEAALDITSRQVEQVSLVLCLPQPLSKFYQFMKMSTLTLFSSSVVPCCCCCYLHIKNRSDLCSVSSNIRTGPTDANAFRDHRLTTQKGYILRKIKNK